MLSTERLKGIATFVAVADAGSFTAAAERLSLTSSAVGKSVARLEQRLGTRLFDRTTRRLALTDAGAAFHRTCVQVLADLEDAEAVLAAEQRAPIGRLRLDVPVAFGRLRVMPALLSFADRHPRLRPHVSFSDRFVDVIEEGIDVAVRIGGPDSLPATLGQRRLGVERVVFCAAPSYLARRGTPATAAALAGHDAVLYGRADGSTSPWRIPREDGLVEQRRVEGRIVVGSGEAQLAALQAGCGIGQMATWLIRDAIARGELVQVLPMLETDGLPLGLVWPRSRQLVPKVATAVEMLAASLRID